MFGIELELHWSFVLFLALLLILDWAFALLLLFVFLFVTLHEFSHALVAMKRGIVVKKVILLPIGGMAVMDLTNIKPKDELLMAVAGPAFNFAMMLLVYLVASAYHMPLMQWFDAFLSEGVPGLSVFEFAVFYSFWANFILGVFNFFIPAFPLDGGRILRALLSVKLGPLRATLIARNISILLSVLMITLGFVAGNVWLIVIGLFLIFGASSEYESLRVLKMIEGYTAGDLLSKFFLVVEYDDPLSEVVRKMLYYHTTSALVRARGKGVRVVSISQINKIPRGEWSLVPAVKASVYVPPASPGSSLESVLKRMNKYDVGLVPVVSGGRIIGVVDKNAVESLVRLKELLS